MSVDPDKNDSLYFTISELMKFGVKRFTPLTRFIESATITETVASLKRIITNIYPIISVFYSPFFLHNG